MSYSLLKRPQLSRLSFLLLFAAYISLCLNIAYYRQAWKLVPLDSLSHGLFFLSMPLVAFSVINILLSLSSFLWLSRLLASLFVIVSAAAQYFIIDYAIVLDRSMIVNMLDTTASESMALLTPQMIITLLLTIVPAVILAWWIKFRPETSVWRSMGNRMLSIVISVACIVLVATFFYKDYASLFRNNKELVKSLSTSNTMVAKLSRYKPQRLAHLPLVQIREESHRKEQLLVVKEGKTQRSHVN